jgi:putative solute:sodium symporter small subunit
MFRPKKGYMRAEVVIILSALFGWGVMIFGFQFLVWLVSEAPNGQSLLTRFSFFNLPFHFWFTAQFLPLWFIILCIIFNLYTERLTERHSRKRDRTYE